MKNPIPNPTQTFGTDAQEVGNVFLGNSLKQVWLLGNEVLETLFGFFGG